VRSAQGRILLLLQLSAPSRARLTHAEQAIRAAAEASTPQLLAAWLTHSAALGPGRAVMWRVVVEARVVARLLEADDPTAVLQLALLLGTSPYGAQVLGGGLIPKTPAVAETVPGEGAVAGWMARLMSPEAAADASAALQKTDGGLAPGLLDAQAKGAREWAAAVARARVLQNGLRRYGAVGVGMMSALRWFGGGRNG
jgi:hypothetical protein